MVGFDNFKSSKNQEKVMGIVDWIADKMGKTPEAVFVFLKAEEYSVEILRKENRNTLSPTMVKIIIFSITNLVLILSNNSKVLVHPTKEKLRLAFRPNTDLNKMVTKFDLMCPGYSLREGVNLE